MILSEMSQQIDVQMGKRVPFGEFFAALLRVVRRINIEGEKPTILISLTGDGDWGYTIDEDETVISDDERIIGAGRWMDDIVYDDINNCITLPAQYKLRHLFADGAKMENVPYDILKQNDINNKCFTQVGQNIYFAGDMDVASYQLTMRARQDYVLPTREADEYSGLPESAGELVFAGMLAVLYSQPKYANDRQQSTYASQFNYLLRQWNENVLRQELQSHQAPTYTWEV